MTHRRRARLGVSRGVALRYDHGPQYMFDDFLSLHHVQPFRGSDRLVTPMRVFLGSPRVRCGPSPGGLRKCVAERGGEAAGILLALCLIAGTATAQGGRSCGFEEWELPVPMDPVWVGLADTLYGFREDRVYESTDSGVTWRQIHSFEGERTCRALFVDSRGSIFVARAGSGELQLGKYHEGLGRVWSEPLAFLCHGGFWKMCEDPAGNLYVGDYETRAFSDTCSFIYKSSDGGDTWTLSYNGTSRHVHFVAADPYTGYVYAALGDNAPRHKVIRSTNAGATWEIIIPAGDNCRAQPVSFVASPHRRYFGTDCGNNGVFSTAGDVAFTDDLVLQGDDNGYVWSMSQNLDGAIVAGTMTMHPNGGTAPGIYVTYDLGATWCRAKTLGIVVGDYRGVEWMSNFDSAGYGYYYDNVNRKTYRFRTTEIEPTGHPDMAVASPARLRAWTFPSPFSTSTDILLDLPRWAESARLRVYNADGRLVRRSVATVGGGDSYRFRWDGTDDRGHRLPSGSYFIKVDLGGGAINLQAVLVR